MTVAVADAGLRRGALGLIDWKGNEERVLVNGRHAKGCVALDQGM